MKLALIAACVASLLGPFELPEIKQRDLPSSIHGLYLYASNTILVRNPSNMLVVAHELTHAAQFANGLVRYSQAGIPIREQHLEEQAWYSAHYCYMKGDARAQVQ